MGNISRHDILRTISVLETVLQRYGIIKNTGQGIETI